MTDKYKTCPPKKARQTTEVRQYTTMHSIDNNNDNK